ncbi:MAG: MerR family transcriptional regulator [Nitrosomonadales bacterium]
MWKILIQENKIKLNLPAIPTKRYFRIGEVSELCDLKPHVLRYWEQEFPQLSPNTRKGNRRYYQVEEILLIRKIRELLYEEGYTIHGAKQKLANREFVKTTTSKEEIQKAQSELPLETENNFNNEEPVRNLKSQLADILKILKS